MANIKFTNNAVSTLAAGITDVATSLTVAAGEGALFPTLGASEYFYCTLTNTAETVREIVKVTARSSDTFTVTRAQDNTTAVAWSTGDRVELRVVAQALNDIAALGGVTSVNGLTGAVTGLASTSSPTLTTPTIEGYTEGVSAPAAGSSFTISLAADTVHGITTDANTAITLPTPTAGKSFQLQIAYGGTHTLTWSVTGGSSIKWPAGTTPTPTSTSGKTDIFNFTCNAAGTAWMGSTFGQNYTT